MTKQSLSFFERFQHKAKQKGIKLKALPITRQEIECNRTIFREERTKEELRTVRWFTIRYASEAVKDILNGSGEAYIGSSEEFMEPNLLETLDVTIPSEKVALDQVWNLYEEWQIKWTSAIDLEELIGEAIREEIAEKGAE